MLFFVFLSTFRPDSIEREGNDSSQPFSVTKTAPRPVPPRRDASGAGRRVRPVDDRRAAPRRAPDDADRRVSFFFFF